MCGRFDGGLLATKKEGYQFFHYPSERVRVALERGSYPDIVRVDNGPEFISVEFKGWAEQHQVLVHYIQPGKPSQNAFIER